MKTRHITLLTALLATVAVAHIDFSPKVINVTPDNADKHRITVEFRTAKDEWDDIMPDQRYVYFTVPASQTNRPLKKISMRLSAQGRYSYVPLSYTLGATNANTSMSMDIAHIPGSIVYANYQIPKGDLGVEYRIMLEDFTPHDKESQNNKDRSKDAAKRSL